MQKWYLEVCSLPATNTFFPTSCANSAVTRCATITNWFFDIVAVHSYDDPWRSGWLTKVVRDALASYKLTRPVWVNETGVSVWNDYPGPIWASSPEQRNRLATAEQQAHFLIMSAAFAWSKGVDKVFFHQLYDDCGNYPAGTDFPPHSGELCANGTCFGDAFGIYRESTEFNLFQPASLRQHASPRCHGLRPLGGGLRQPALCACQLDRLE